MGNLGGIPIRSQKQLRDKNGKSHNGRWYKKGVAMNSEMGTNGGEIERKERIENKRIHRKTREKRNKDWKEN